MADAGTRKAAKLLVDRLLAEDEHRGIAWEELPNGDLRITVDDDVREEIKEKMHAGLSDEEVQMGVSAVPTEPMLWDVLEPMTANSEIQSVRPEEIAALTDAPILSDAGRDDHGELQMTPESKVWWYPGYATRDPLDDLIEKGETVFTRVHNE
jgi:hypothetical protein